MRRIPLCPALLCGHVMLCFLASPLDRPPAPNVWQQPVPSPWDDPEAGHDGGWSYSNDHGYDGTWTSRTNYLTITQYTECDGRIYRHGDGWIYSRSNLDLVWLKESVAEFTNSVSELTVSPVSGHTVIWACLSTDTEYQCYVKQGDWWYNRKSGLPVGTRVRKVVPHPTDPNAAYALMNGLSSPGQKIYYTSNLGRDWDNITGNLPNLPLADLIVYPDNDQHLYLGTAYGHARSLDGGASWHRSNNGCPKAVVVTELKAVDMRPLRQGFHIVSATYGRSIWRREVGYDDPAGVPEIHGESLAIRSVSPNPFNPGTTILFDLAADARGEAAVFDLAGLRVETLLSEMTTAGPQRAEWRGRDAAGKICAAGVYVVRIQAGDEVETQKIVLAK